MTIFCLTPIEASHDDLRWQVSKKNVPCWVEAESEAIARLRVGVATFQHFIREDIETAEDSKPPSSPWEPPEPLAACIEDNSMLPKHGFVKFHDGDELTYILNKPIKELPS